MHMLDSVKRQLTPVHPEGYKFIAIFAIITVALAWLWQPLGWLGAFLTCWCAYFFRDPVRTTPLDADVVVSPADGIISAVGFFTPPPELGLGPEKVQRISVFMSVFDCHVNRMPVAGQITKIAYRPGLFVNADLDKASDDNERNAIAIQTPRGRFGVVQIAGLVARRIVCFNKQGDMLAAGERFGLIRFGSRVDVYFPQTARPLVAVGSKAVAGETVLADYGAETETRSFRAG